VEIARRGGLRFVGPNCMGNFNTYSGFSTVAYLPPAGRGPLALIAQSGNTSEWIIHSGGEVGLGFSKYVSSGNEADLHFEDYLEYLSQDAETGVVLGYVEGLREGRRFLETAKRITREKPVVLLKAGRTEAGSRAARSHTAALAGSDLVCDAAFRQSGVIRVDEAGELIDVALALLGQPLPRGRRVGVLATGGGAAVVTADALTRHGLELPPFSATTIERLNSILPRRWSHGNPIDNGGEPIDYGCLWALMEDDAIDAVVMIGAAGVGAKYSGWLSIPPSFGDAVDQWLREAERVEMGHLETMVELMDRYQKPVVLAHNGIPTVRQGELYDWLQRSHLVPYLTPERAAKALARLADYSEYLQLAKAEADQARRAPRSV
jgi:acyl-CoA synthetase (NDP forming)